jgi:methionyl-tRNA formyltransferase
MKVILVTSQATLVKDNYLNLLKILSDQLQHHELVLVLIENRTKKAIKQTIRFILNGGYRIGVIVLKNMVTSFLKRRERYYTEVFYTKNINHKKSVEYLKNAAPDLIINIRTRNIYKEEVLQIPRIGCINVHHGLLPNNRGTMCNLWALYEQRPIGFSIHWMVKKVDAGNILINKEIDSSEVKSFAKLPTRSSQFETEELIKLINDIGQGKKMPEIGNIRTDQTRYRRDPTKKDIQKMKKAGIRV